MEFSKIFSALSPKDRKFFPLFNQAAQNLVDISVLLHKLILNNEEKDVNTLCTNIKEMEKKGDELAVAVYKELNGTFITPFDREDIQEQIGRAHV